MSMAHITTRDMGMDLVKAAVGNHMDIQGLCIPGLACHWMRHSAELAPCLTCDCTLGRRPCTSLGQDSYLALIKKAQDVSAGELVLPHNWLELLGKSTPIP